MRGRKVRWEVMRCSKEVLSGVEDVWRVVKMKWQVVTLNGE